MRAPHPWEKSYPAGVRWDTPIERATLPALLDRAVAAYADRPAFEYRGRRLSYRAFGEMADRAAAAFLALGIGKGEKVALYLPNTPFHPIAFFGAMRAGATVVHLSPLDAVRDLLHKLEDSGARTLVTTDLAGLAGKAERLRASGHLDRVIVGEDAVWGVEAAPLAAGALSLARLMNEAALPRRWPDLTPDDLAVLQYTGATTGIPKAAMLTHGNLTAANVIYRAWAAPQIQASPEPHRVLMVLPLFHIYGLSSVMIRHLSLGNELLLRPRFDIQAVLRDIEVERVTSFAGVPTMWIALVNYPGIEKRDLSSLRVVASGGAPLPVKIAERFQRLTGLPLPSGWGMTETSPVGIVPPPGPIRKPGSIGLPLPGITAAIVALDDPRKVLGANESGELRISGPNVTQGYWRHPKETAAAFVDGAFLTGDIGYYDEDGFFFLVDRKKEMIISGGFNVYPVKIEYAIYEHRDIEEALVIGTPDSYRGEAAKAFVKLKSGAPALTLEALRDFLKHRLGPHEMPVALELRDALPKTPAGKFSKAALIEEERAKHKQDKAHA